MRHSFPKRDAHLPHLKATGIAGAHYTLATYTRLQRRLRQPCPASCARTPPHQLGNLPARRHTHPHRRGAGLQPAGRISSARPSAPRVTSAAAGYLSASRGVTNMTSPRTSSSSSPAKAAGRAPARSRPPAQPPEAGQACRQKATEPPRQRSPPP